MQLGLKKLFRSILSSYLLRFFQNKSYFVIFFFRVLNFDDSEEKYHEIYEARRKGTFFTYLWPFVLNCIPY